MGGLSWALGPFIQQQMVAFVNEFNLMFTVLEALLAHILADCLLTRLKVWHYGVWLNRSPRESSFSLLPSLSIPLFPSFSLLWPCIRIPAQWIAPLFSLSHTHSGEQREPPAGMSCVRWHTVSFIYFTNCFCMSRMNNWPASIGTGHSLI